MFLIFFCFGKLKHNSMSAKAVNQGPAARQNAQRAIAGKPLPRAAIANMMPQAQAVNAQQLAAVVGDAEAACMMSSGPQIVFQKEVSVVETPILFRQNFVREVPREVHLAPTATIIQNPQAQMQMNSCLQAPLPVAAPCCADSCNPCAEQVGFAGIPLEAPLMNPYAWPAAAAWNGGWGGPWANGVW
jgi:hypothetical protein